VQPLENTKTIIDYLANNWLALLSLAISVIALCIVWKKNIWDKNNADDKELLEQLKLSLQQAFDSIAYEGEGDYSLLKDRLGWLTGARHIVRYQKLRNRLKTDLHKIICDEQEEFWRHKFYVLLQKIPNAEFFTRTNSVTEQEENISPESAAVIYAFSKWKKDASDPLDSFSLEQIVAQYDLFSPMHAHFRDYIEMTFPNLAKKIKMSERGHR